MQWNSDAVMQWWASHLLQGKDVLVEVELDLLIGDVDAELLERVLLEVLEAEDVQDAHIHPTVCGAGQRRTDDRQKVSH